MQFEELINGFAGRFGIAEGQINDGTAVFDIDGMTVGFVNDETAAITIHYSEPEGFPFKFSWETTVALDGTSTTTPVIVEPAA